MMDLEYRITELERRVANLLRIGVVEDHGRRRHLDAQD